MILQDNPNILQIKAGKSNTAYLALRQRNLNLSEGELSKEIEVNASGLLGMIDKTRFAISTMKLATT